MTGMGHTQPKRDRRHLMARWGTTAAGHLQSHAWDLYSDIILAKGRDRYDTNKLTLCSIQPWFIPLSLREPPIRRANRDVKDQVEICVVIDG
jgi:hypothetical protein